MLGWPATATLDGADSESELYVIEWPVAPPLLWCGVVLAVGWQLRGFGASFLANSSIRSSVDSA